MKNWGVLLLMFACVISTYLSINISVSNSLNIGKYTENE